MSEEALQEEIDRLAAALERAERMRDAVRFCPYCSTGFIPNPGDEHKDSCPGCARAEKAELALAEAADRFERIEDSEIQGTETREQLASALGALAGIAQLGKELARAALSSEDTSDES